MPRPWLHSPPELNADAMAEILIRIPPDEPAYLFRASLVCKVWRRILTDPDFIRCYRRFHRTPPLLGFFHQHEIMAPFPRFIPSVAASPFPQAAFNFHPWVALDCRHGRVLLRKTNRGNFFVWDPITGDLEELGKPDIPHTSAAALVCSVAGCDHRDCRNGPFLVVCVGEDGDRVAHACLYSSESGGAWGTPVSVHLGVHLYVNSHCGTLIGNEIYFVLGQKAGILMYNLRKHNLSVIDPPEFHGHIVLMSSEDGLLEVAGMRDSGLYLCSRKANEEGVVGWVQRRAIKLQRLPTNNPLKPSNVRVIGSAKGGGVIFMSTNAGAFIVELKSRRARKVGQPGSYFNVIPFMSFYTPDCTSVRLPFTDSEETH